MTHFKKTFLFVVLILSTATSYAQTDTKPVAGETVDIKKVSQKYINNQYEVEMNVIQNRQFSKANRFEFNVMGLSVNSDLFLTTYSVGASLGYHFSEYWGVRAVYWKDFSSTNNAYKTFVEKIGGGSSPNPVEPNSYMGAELKFSPFYGKLSFLKKSIVYYDFYALAGLGLRKMEYNNALAPTFGLGQQFFISKFFSLFMEYRMMYFKQVVKDEGTTSPTFGQELGSPSSFVNNFSFGFSFLI
jgi:outer membrane beta-barrel protein